VGILHDQENCRAARREATNWLASLDANPAGARAVHAWAEREETYRLRVEVEEPTGWQVRGTLLGGGPLLAEDRVIRST